jgi:hypothetical protein
MSPVMARNGHADCIARCPLSGAKRKTYPRSELFRFWPNSDIAVAWMVELFVPAEATRSLFCRVIEYPSQWCFGARSAYSLW